MIWLTFIRNNWQALAVIAIVGVVFIRVQVIKSERDNALAKIEAMQNAALKRDAEVTLLTKQGKQAVEKLQNGHVKDIQHIGALYGREIQNISNYRDELADKLRKQSGSGGGILSSNDAHQSASTDSNTTITESPETDYRMMYLGAQEYIKLLEQAGAVCAADYNMCHDYVTSEQSRIGVNQD